MLILAVTQMTTLVMTPVATPVTQQEIIQMTMKTLSETTLPKKNL